MHPLARSILLSTSCAAALAVPAPAFSHPHVFAEARLDVMVTPQGDVKSLRHLWRFDDLFSSTVLLEFDANSDLKLDADELKEVSRVVYDSIGEYNYFQMVRADDKPVAMKPPPGLMVDYQDDQLVILFETEPASELKLSGKLEFGVYDPTFYTAIDFIEDDKMSVDHLPRGCASVVVRPDPDEALVQNQAKLTEDYFNDPAVEDIGALFATRLEITCGAAG
jgi:ABC-type uncharacterized transport system substrate-binding protein